MKSFLVFIASFSLIFSVNAAEKSAGAEDMPQGFKSGDAEKGSALVGVCASCHGVFGEGEDRWPVIAGGIGTLMEEKPEKTVGSYWPYVSTLWDYIHRAMPFLQPQSLTDNEVYALTAYVLYLNDQVDEDFVLTKHNLPTITLPNEKGFFIDPRPEVLNSRCMTNCLTTEQMSSWSAADLGVTPLGHLSNVVPAVSQDSSESDGATALAIETYKNKRRQLYDYMETQLNMNVTDRKTIMNEFKNYTSLSIEQLEDVLSVLKSKIIKRKDVEGYLLNGLYIKKSLFPWLNIITLSSPL